MFTALIFPSYNIKHNLLNDKPVAYSPSWLIHQQGAALAMVLMITLVIVALSVSLATGVFGEHRLSRNAADLAIARQAAEAALRDAEHDVLCERWNASTGAFEFHSAVAGNANAGGKTNPRMYCNTSFQNSVDRAGSIGDAGANIDFSWANGMRKIPPYAGTLLSNINFSDVTCNCFTVFGGVTEQPSFKLSDLPAANQPRPPVYSIEVFSVPTGSPKPSAPTFRITARGYGRNPTTTVDLQSVFRPLGK